MLVLQNKILYIIVLFLLYFLACHQKEELLEEHNTFPSETFIESRMNGQLEVVTSIQELKLLGTPESYGHVWAPYPNLPTLADEHTVYPLNLLPTDSIRTIRTTTILSNPEQSHHLRPYIKTSLGVSYGSLMVIEPIDEVAINLGRILKDSLSTKDFGYSYVVVQKGTVVASGAGGFQSRAFEHDLEIAMSTSSKMQIASMTKTLTATAFLQLAKKNNLSASTKIANYLPGYWKKGPLIESLTFADLLKHQSGFRDYNNTCHTAGALLENWWGGLQEIIEKGVTASNQQYCYQNSNYSLFRVLIPSLLGYQYKDATVDETASARIYNEYIENEIFKKSGTTTSQALSNDPQRPTLGYSYPYQPTTRGFNPGQFYNTPGAYGYYLSAMQAGRIYSSIFATNASLLDKDSQAQMLSNGFGCFATITPLGDFYYHDGIWYVGGGTSTIPPQGFRSIWIKGPDDILLVLFTNAIRIDDGLFPLRSAYYYDITSFALWAFYQANGLDNVKGRTRPINFHNYLTHPEPH